MSGNKDEQKIREVIATWMRATAKGEIDTVLNLMANDVVFLTCGNPPIRCGAGKAFAAAMREAMKGGRIEGQGGGAGNHRRRRLRLPAGIISQITVKPTDGSPRLKREGAMSSRFFRRKERDGHWVIWRDANLLDA